MANPTRLHLIALVAGVFSAGLNARAMAKTPASDTLVVTVLCGGDAQLDHLADRLIALAVDRGWEATPYPTSPLHPFCSSDRVATSAMAESLSTARRLFYRADFAAAEQTLLTLEQRFHRAESLFSRLDLYLDLEALLGWIALAQRNTGRARRHFHRIAQLRPNWRPSTKEYPTEFAARYQRFAREVTDARDGQLIVDIQPPGTRVVLDGQKTAESPCTFSSLVAGYHFIETEHPRFPPHGARIRVNGQTILRGAVQADLRPKIAAALRSHELSRLANEHFPGRVLLIVSGEPASRTVTLTLWHPGASANRIFASVAGQADTALSWFAEQLQQIRQQQTRPRPDTTGPAQPGERPTPRSPEWVVSIEPGAALLLSPTQREHFKPLGGTGTAHLELRAPAGSSFPPEWLAVTIGGGWMGGFGAKTQNDRAQVWLAGGGLVLRWPTADWPIAPRVTAESAYARTGEVSTLAVRASFAFEIDLGALELRPHVGYLRLFDRDTPYDTGDADAINAGVGVGWAWDGQLAPPETP